MDAFTKWAEDHGLSDSEKGIAEAAWKACLAARQPVGQIVGWQHCADNYAHMVISDSNKSALKQGETEEGIRKIDAAYCIPLVRQPVGEPVAWLIERLRGKSYGRDKYVVMKGQASSDPDSHLFWTDQQARDNHRVTPLYAVLPAQAVDMEQFRDAVEDGIAWNGCLYSTGQLDGCRMIEVRDKYRALLALIDNQIKPE